MIDIKIDLEEDGVIEGTLPENWDEVKVSDYEKIFEVDLSELSAVYQYLHIISSLTGIDKEIILQLPLDEFKNLISKIEFINSEVPKDECEFVEINGEKYYMYNNYSSFNAGEIISIDTILTQNKNNFNKCLSDLLCVFLRKKKDNGKYEKFSTLFFERKSEFQTLPLKQVYHLLTFFLSGRK